MTFVKRYGEEINFGFQTKTMIMMSFVKRLCRGNQFWNPDKNNDDDDICKEITWR